MSHLDHVHEGEKYVMGALGESDIWVKPVLEQKGQQVSDELKRLRLLLHPGHRYVLRPGVHQHLYIC